MVGEGGAVQLGGAGREGLILQMPVHGREDGWMF